MVCRVGVRVVPWFLNSDNIGFKNPRVPEEVCYNDVLRAVDVVLDYLEAVLFIRSTSGWFGIGITAGDVTETA